MVGGRDCGGQSLTVSEVEESYWGDGNILKLNYGISCTNLNLLEII